jgi:nucleotide-binding universal stress UspA family protein
MVTMAWLWAIVVVWLVAGAATAVVLARRGHDPAVWAVIGLVLGPVAPVLGIASVRAESRQRALVVHLGRRGLGSTDVLVGIDGSPEAEASLRLAVALHGRSLGRLALATVVPFDEPSDADAVALLRAASHLVPKRAPTTVVLRGEPADALGHYAHTEGYDLLAVGSHGRGRSGSPLGSVAGRLAANAPVPVLVSPRSIGGEAAQRRP